MGFIREEDRRKRALRVSEWSGLFRKEYRIVRQGELRIEI
jgi:hypothetical protein